MSEIKNGGLDQYGAECSEEQQFGTAGIEGVNNLERAFTLCHRSPVKLLPQRYKAYHIIHLQNTNYQAAGGL